MSVKRNEIKEKFTKLLNEVHEIVRGKVLRDIGESIVTDMHKFISKGVSPIEGAGRFPEYKTVSELKGARSKGSTLRKLSRSVRSRGAKNSAQLRRSILKNKRQLSIAKRGYPYSVQDEFKNKKPRPVNLFLSGDFLSQLTYQEFVSGASSFIKVGFFGGLSEKKEQGHRVGAPYGKTPKRPIIPNGTEEFNRSIMNNVLKIAKDAINRYLSKV
jgi:hypothetical protein